MQKDDFMRRAIQLSEEMMHAGKGGPFGAVIVKDGAIIAEGHNMVTSANDPTAHAEIVAIRAACAELGTFVLSGCEVYTSCEPCPMCLSAIYWARLDKIYFANTHADAARIGFDDAFIYSQFKLSQAERSLETEQLLPDEAIRAFQEWDDKSDKTPY